MQTMTRLRADVTQRLEKPARIAMLRAYGSSRLNGAFSAIERSVDIDRIKRLRREVASQYREQPYSAAKYAKFFLWMLRNLNRGTPGIA